MKTMFELLNQEIEDLFAVLNSGNSTKITETLNERARRLGTTTSIFYEKGSITEKTKLPQAIVERLRKLGSNVVVITCENSRRVGSTDAVLKKLKDIGLEVIPIEGITTSDLYAEVVDEKVKRITERGKAHFVVGLGGGTAMDFAKSVAIALGHPGKKFSDFMPYRRSSMQHENIVVERVLPTVFIPSNPCTSTEINRKIVIKSKNSTKIQEGLAAKDLPRPTLAIIDPTLAKTVPLKIFSRSISDILSAAVEYGVYYEAHERDSMQKEGLLNQATCMKFLVKLLPLLESYARGDKEKLNQISEYLYLAELLKGMGTANTLLPHRLSYPLTNMFGVPHNIAVSIGLFSWVKRVASGNLNFFGLIGQLFNPEVCAYGMQTKAACACKGIQNYLDRISCYWEYDWDTIEILPQSIPTMRQEVLQSHLLAEDPLTRGRSEREIGELVENLYGEGLDRVKERMYLTPKALTNDPRSLLVGSAEGSVEDTIRIRVKPGKSLLQVLKEKATTLNIKKADIVGAAGKLSEVEFRNLTRFNPCGVYTNEDRLFVQKKEVALVELNGHILPNKEGSPVLHVHFSARLSGGNLLGGHLTESTITGKGVVVNVVVLTNDTPMVAGRNAETSQDDVFFLETSESKITGKEAQITRVHARIKKGIKLQDGIQEIIERYSIQEAEIVYGIGALRAAREKETAKTINKPLELISLRGNISQNGNGKTVVDARFSASTVEKGELITVEGSLSEWDLTTDIKVLMSLEVIRTTQTT